MPIIQQPVQDRRPSGEYFVLTERVCVMGLQKLEEELNIL